ncbi:hypothetical protein ABK040_013740 [Willaertia magna]
MPLATTRLTDLEEELLLHIFDFILELPLSTVKDNNALSFAHTSSKLLNSCEKHNYYQLHKFLQFYCMGNKCNRYNKIESYYKDENKLEKLVPVIFYLNFPSLDFLKSLKLDNFFEIENNYRNLFNITKYDYEDYLFKIDRIIEMIVNFVNFYNNYNDDQKDTFFKFNRQDLLNVLLKVDEIINESMRVFHWKGFTSDYNEKPYLNIPKEELPNIYKKYQQLDKCLNLLNTASSNEDINNIELLIKDMNIFYCDKLAYFVYTKLSSKMTSNSLLKTKYINLQGVHQSLCFYKESNLKRDHELITHLLLSNREALVELPEDLQYNKQYLLQIIRHDTKLIVINYDDSYQNFTDIYDEDSFDNYVQVNDDNNDKYEKILEVVVNDRQLLLECLKHVSNVGKKVVPLIYYKFFKDVISTYKKLKGKKALSEDLEFINSLKQLPFQKSFNLDL